MLRLEKVAIVKRSKQELGKRGRQKNKNKKNTAEKKVKEDDFEDMTILDSPKSDYNVNDISLGIGPEEVTQTPLWSLLISRVFILMNFIGDHRQK